MEGAGGGGRERETDRQTDRQSQTVGQTEHVNHSCMFHSVTLQDFVEVFMSGGLKNPNDPFLR